MRLQGVGEWGRGGEEAVPKFSPWPEGQDPRVSKPSSSLGAVTAAAVAPPPSPGLHPDK